MIDIFNLRYTEIVDILSGTVDFNLVVDLKTPDRSEVKRSKAYNTNVTEASTSFNKSRPQENGKTDSKIVESILEHNKIFGSI